MTEATLAPVAPATTTFFVGQHIVLPQDFNATCGTIVSISKHADGSLWAMCEDVHDIFGKLTRRANISLAHALPLPHPPRSLSLAEALSY